MRRMKTIIAAILAISILAGSALADCYTGSVQAIASQTVEAKADGTLERVYVRAGQTVQTGDPIALIAKTDVFAAQDGTIASIDADVGDRIGESETAAVAATEAVQGMPAGFSAGNDGMNAAQGSNEASQNASEETVLTLAPVNRYTIYCTSEEAYDEPENMLIHGGETVYVSCTSNGTHRAVGTVYQIDSDEYRVSVFGGELYIGETVYLYRSDSFEKAERVGIGTVVSADPEEYGACGTITDIYVSAGDSVERGQILFSYVSGDSCEIQAACDGAVLSLDCAPGDSVQQDGAIATIVTAENLAIRIQVPEDEAANIRAGDSAAFTRADDPDETEYSAVIAEVSDVVRSGYRTVLLSGTDIPLLIGLTVEVRI